MSEAKVKAINLQALKSAIPEVKEIPVSKRNRAPKPVEEPKPVLEDSVIEEGAAIADGEQLDENAARVKDADWYVVHTYSGYENKVKANIEKAIENRSLQDEILEVRVPMENVVEMKNGSRRTVEKKLFPGYVLINMIMNDETWYVVRNTRGVTGFVGPGSKPVPLSELEMKPLGIRTENISVDFEEGDTIVAVAGAWKDTIGVVRRMDFGKQTVTINVEMFGRETPVEISFAEVRKYR